MRSVKTISCLSQEPDDGAEDIIADLDVGEGEQDELMEGNS